MSDKLKSTNPRFSIVIPAYNEEAFIGDTLKSLEKQNYNGSFEVIVVDNNSVDQTATIARQHGSRVVTEKNKGVCWARQRGTESAKGNIVISTDADTTFSANWLTSIDKTFINNPALVAVASPCKYVGGPLWGRIYAQSLFSLVNAGYKVTGQTYYASATNIAFKKSAFEAYNTKLPQGGDELDLIRNLKKKGPIKFNYNNPTYTSSRRLKKGFVYNFFVSWLLYYIIEYNLNRLFNKSILGPAPSFRSELTPRRNLFIRIGIVSILTLLLLILLSRHQIQHAAKNIDALI